MVLYLLLPESVDEIALEVVWCVFEQGSVASLLTNLGVAFAERVQALFL
jgi:hypothetical protein